EVGTEIPAAVPGVSLQSNPEFFDALPAPDGPRCVAALFRQLREGGQNGGQEPAVPNTLAFAARADAIHAIVPVAGSHQRQTVDAQPEAALQGAGAVLVEARLFLRFVGPVVYLLL